MNDPGGIPFSEYLDTTGAIGLLCLIVAAFVRGWVLMRRDHEAVVARLEKQLADMTADRNDWRDIAFGGTRSLKSLAATLKDSR